MKAQQLYKQLEQDFIKAWVSDEWTEYMTDIKWYLSPNFLEKEMWVMCDFAKEIDKVYTAVFPSEKVLGYILDNHIENAMVFLHHAAIWDIRNAPSIFYNISISSLKKLKKQKIALFVFHTPLDDFGQYSTSVNFAKSIWLVNLKAYWEYYGTLAWVIGNTKFDTISKLVNSCENAIWHKAKLYKYWSEKILNWTVWLVAWWGTETFLLEDLIKNWINTYITWVSQINDYSQNFHKLAQKNKINLVWTTHYSSEKFAMIAMLQYFQNLWLEAEFIKDKADLLDL